MVNRKYKINFYDKWNKLPINKPIYVIKDPVSFHLVLCLSVSSLLQTWFSQGQKIVAKAIGATQFIFCLNIFQ